MFGLTFEQLGYALPTALIAFYLIFKSGLSFMAGSVISMFVAVVAFFFMFLDGRKQLTNVLRHLKNKEAEVLSPVLKRIIDIERIKEGIVYQKKSKLAILEVTPLNFMLKTKEEKEGIIVGFRKFLNSLDFPIQIHITSDTINLEKHFKQTKAKIGNKIKVLNARKSKIKAKKEIEGLNSEIKRLEKLSKSYQSFVTKTIESNKIQNRKFYLIIKEKEDLELQAKVCIEKLQNLGLKVKQLDNEAIVDYFYSYIAGSKDKELNQNEVKDVAHFIYSPEKIKFSHDYFRIDDRLCRVIAVTGYPHSVEMGFLDKIVSSGENYDISLHIKPYPIEQTMLMLNKELVKQQSDMYAEGKKGILNPSLEIKFQGTKKVLEDLQKGKEKLFDISFYVVCKSTTKVDNSDKKSEEKAQKEINLLSKKIKAELDSLMIENQVPIFQMSNAYESTIPLGKNSLGINRNIHTQGLAAFFPFSSPFLELEDNGTLLGLNKNKIPYIKDIFGLTNANGIVLATSGSGKSYFTKLLLSRQFLNSTDIITIDPQGEYLAITDHYGGECITISKNSKTIINPLDLMGHEYLEKRLSLMDVFQIMFGDLNELQKSILDKAIDLTYEDCGITRDDYDSHEPPTMTDLYNTLLKLEKPAIQQEKVTYRALINRLHMYTKNGVFGFLDRQTQINFENNFVCFNIGNMPKQVKPVVMYLVLDYVFMRMKNSNRRKLLVIDEAWSMLQTAEESSYIFEIVKTCRKYNLGLLMITQDVADLVASKAGHAVLANTSYTFLLRQKPAVINNVAKTFNLSQTEKDFLISAKQGAGVLILENDHQELEVISSPEEHKLITTNPDELIRLNEKKKPKESKVLKESEKANIDLDRIVYPVKGLTILQQNFLDNQGYVLKKGHGLSSGPHNYYVKPRPPESTEHSLLVGLIMEETVKYTDKIWTKQTKGPDIIFENKVGQKIVLEIETGKSLDKNKVWTDEKFKAAKMKYGNRLYIVLTNNRRINSYVKYNTKILLRNNIIEFIRFQFSGQKNSNIWGILKHTNKQIPT